ncbi:spore protease YyaC [Halanaerobacter jeridensis]|uniref:Sporulation protein YyaC n=1 Tax=Halanaerobacter jeridensis TaxID=706427 RepID=A0A939BPX6_9FIRM|nr:spore protease YyaC [Halanaerobacter jeridensis]MBM7557617.1 putative sporulation protein YyaC [Halanaerobacter jeridensis]
MSSKTSLFTNNIKPKKKKNINNKVHIDDPLAISNLNQIIRRKIQNITPVINEVIIFCIGTDRSTGDALGPLIGSKLQNFNLNPKINVYGTLEEPVHATNLEQNIKKIKEQFDNPLIIAIDAGLGKNKSVGNINVNTGPLKPGSGVNKKLPAIGDFHITGLVNVGGYMEYFVLQSTRLSIVIKMSKIITYALVNSFKRLTNDKRL